MAEICNTERIRRCLGHLFQKLCVFRCALQVLGTVGQGRGRARCFRTRTVYWRNFRGQKGGWRAALQGFFQPARASEILLSVLSDTFAHSAKSPSEIRSKQGRSPVTEPKVTGVILKWRRPKREGIFALLKGQRLLVVDQL
jgi:hypothetical protein